MQWSSVFKVVGLILLIALGVATAAYQKEENPNLMYLFGLYLLTGLLGAFYFFKVILPALGDSITTAMVESGEEPDEPPMVRIRALIAQGEYATAAEELVHVAAENPGDRIPWMERAKLLEEKLSDVDGAIATYEECLESYPWEEEDAAFYLFRLLDLYEQKGDSAQLSATLDRIIEKFPNTRYSANANHKKRDLAAGDSASPASAPDPSSPPPPGKPASPPPPPPGKPASPPPPSAT